MYRIAFLVLALAFLTFGPMKQAYAMDSINFGAVRCSEFIEELSDISDDDAGIVLVWLDGYLSGVTGDTVLRFGALEDIGEALVNGCAESPNSKVLDVVRIVGIRH
ncbi:HdeA/HdeB family chaperone [Desulfovibrio inopinatus]|uniref:HdeA/HdeB family chaperone n=1 Tax=Desulfovibrio inopinatus TaxID=102109 RepID=UPI00041AC68A|nr:HdeA/HdeB family chaperone [Desulfovibrio inopinatus]